MSKLLFLLFLASCNPISNSTNVDADYKPGVPTGTTPPAPPTANTFKKSDGFKVLTGSGTAVGSQVGGEFEVAPNGGVLNGSQIKAEIHLNTTVVN